jgi:hypothetical protein
MKKTVSYNRIERITYKFTADEIKEALIEKWKIAVPSNAGIESFDVCEEYYHEDKNITEPAYAELIIKYMLEDKECSQ